MQSYATCTPKAMNESLMSIVCAEMLSRTLVSCDAATDFQRVVSLSVAARHGTWSYSQESQTFTLYCQACEKVVRDENRLWHNRAASCSLARSRSVGAVSCLTPSCDPRVETVGCRYAAESADAMNRRWEFMQENGDALKRIKMASRVIRDCVT